MIDVAELGIEIDYAQIEKANAALDKLGATATRTDSAVKSMAQGGFRQSTAVARDVERAMGEGVTSGSRQAEAALRRVEFASFAVVESGNLTSGALRGMAIGLGGLTEAALPWVAIGTVVVEVIMAIAHANKEATKAADDAAEAERRRIDAIKPVVTLNRTPQQQISELENASRRDHERAAAIRETVKAQIDAAAIEQVRHPLMGNLIADARDATQADLEHAGVLDTLADRMHAAAEESRKAIATNAAQADFEAGQAFVEQLTRTADIVGKTREQIEDYDLSVRHLTATQRAAAEAELARARVAEITQLPGLPNSGPGDLGTMLGRAIAAAQKERQVTESTSAAHAAAKLQVDALAQSYKDYADAIARAVRELEQQKAFADRYGGHGGAPWKQGVDFGTDALSSVTSPGGIREFLNMVSELNPVLGAAVGLFGGLADTLFGASQAAAEYARWLEEQRRIYAGLQRQLAIDISGIGSHDSMVNAVRDQEAQRRQLVQEAGGAYGLHLSGTETLAQLETYKQKLPGFVKGIEEIFAKIDQEIAIVRRRANEDLDVRLLRALGNTGGADDLAFQLQQQREMEDARRSGADEAYRAYLAEVQLAEARARSNARIQQTIDELSKTIDNLANFRGTLSLNSSLSPLSPTQRLEEARRQYHEVVAAAYGGDQTAAGKLPAAAQAFLEASRAVNASSIAYVTDFNRVRDDTDALMKIFQDSKSVQQSMLDRLIEIGDGTAKQVQALEDNMAVLQGGFADTVQELADVAAAVRAQTAALKSKLSELDV